MAVNNNATLIRRDLLAKSIELFLNSQTSKMDRIPIAMRPKNNEHIRCCIYKDRAVLKYKLMSIFGVDSSEETDELKSLSLYFDEMLDSNLYGDNLLTIVDEACRSCKSGNYIVTNMCKGCVGRSCMMNCSKNAISIKNGQAIIDEEGCINCGLCQKVCPYHAIIYTPVPCEESCPVKAIAKDDNGKERIDEHKCIHCGKCVESCPFGAIIEKSDVYKVLSDIKKKQNVIAIVAPSFFGQFKASVANVIKTLKELGFNHIVEVAEGANITTKEEANEWLHRIKEGQSFMTTSCCPSYVNLVEKHIPELKENISETPSPMYFTAKIVRNEFAASKIVFVSPCLGKKNEAQNNADIDYVINFEEVGAWMLAKGLEIKETDDEPERDIASGDSRGYAMSGGVTNAILNYLENPEMLQGQIFNGIDKQAIRNLKMMKKRPVDINFLEVMSCENGCVGGCNTIAKPNVAKRQIENLVKQDKKVLIS